MRVADQLEADDSLRRQVKAAMAYPIVVMVFALHRADRAGRLPRAGLRRRCSSSSAASCRRSPSSPSASSNAITGYWYLPSSSAVGIVFALQEVEGHRRGPQAVGHLPPAHPDEDRRHRPEDRARPLVAHALGARQRRRAALQALEITGKTAGNWSSRRRWPTSSRPSRGGTIAEPLKKPPVFPGMVTHMIGVGEETGAMDTMLSKIADFYEDQVEAAVKQLTSILEPVMIVLVGGMVGFIVDLHVHAALQGLRPDQVGRAVPAAASASSSAGSATAIWLRPRSLAW